MQESILTSVKKMLGIEEEYDHFDMDIILHINTFFSVLHQMGVGPVEGFQITNETQNWSDFANVSEVSLNIVKNYIYMNVKLVFDPPSSSSTVETYNKLIKECEWRLYTDAEFKMG